MANSCRASASDEQGLPFEPERREPRRRRRRAEQIGERARARVADVAVADEKWRMAPGTSVICASIQSADSFS